MSIKSFSEMQNTFQSYGAKNWSKSVELGKRIDFTSTPETNEGDKANGTQSFGEFLANSLSKVNELQQDANVAMEKIASGESKNIHETLLAVERADIAFRTMNQVRQKVLDAYKEMMRMQI